MSRHTAQQDTIYYRRRPPIPPPDVHVPAPQQGRSRRRLWLVSLALLLILGAAALSGAGYYVYESNRILPGVHTLGMRLGGQRVDEATAALERSWNAREIVVEVGDGTLYTLRPASLGIILDARGTALAAYRQGRNIPDIEGALRDAFTETGFEPTWAFDPAVARAALEELAPLIAIPPVDAGVQLVNGRVEPTSPSSGRELDVAATLSWLQDNAAYVRRSAGLPLKVTPVEPAIGDTSLIAEKANQLLATPIRVRTYDPIYDEAREDKVSPETWTKWLSLQVNPDDPRDLSWHVDATLVEAYLANEAVTLGAERYLDVEKATTALVEAITTNSYEVRLRIYHHQRTHVVQPGETLSSIALDYGIPYPWIQEANPGMGSGLYPGQSVTIPSPDELLPLPVVEDKRIVVSLGEQRMWVYEGGALRWEWTVSTGIESSPTAPGVFQIQTHESEAYASIWDLWMPYFMGIYRPVPTSDFMNGFHGFPTRNGTNLLWTNSLGHPVTYGCILVSNDNVRPFYEWAEEGVVVEVRR